MTKPPAPPRLTKAMVKLARQIHAAATVDFVPVEAEESCAPGECFDNVTAIVRQRGGSIQYGWRLREQHLAFVEGEFHAVWRRPDGALVDITPRPDGVTTILFLADSRTVWTGEPVESRRNMLHEQPCYCGNGMPFKICHGAADE